MAVHIEAMEQQHERGFQKQRCATSAGKKAVLAHHKKQGGKTKRYTRSVGLGFETPNAAIEGTYVDNKCPFSSNVFIRGRILKGMVISTKMKRSLVIRRHYLHYVPKYNRFEKRHTNITCHVSPAFECKEGDIVTVGQCRPLSKTIRFNVLKVEPRQIFGSAKKQFCLF